MVAMGNRGYFSNNIYKDILVIYLIYYRVWVPVDIGTIKSVFVSV